MGTMIVSSTMLARTVNLEGHHVCIYVCVYCVIVKNTENEKKGTGVL